LQTEAERMATVAQQKHEGIGKYLGVYLCILILAGLQFVIAYQNITTSQMFRRMLSVAVVEAGVAVMFFMHLWSEKRGFLLFVVAFVIFVLLSMQFGWTDSFRLTHCTGYCS
jgi:cytochrome c oxidase subunit IV